LNTKVFSRLGLNVPPNITTNICNNKPGYIEVFLHNLRYKIEETVEKEAKAKATPRKSANFAALSSQVGKNSKGFTNKIRIEYEEKVQECLRQSEEIEVLHAKVRRLEHLVELKEARIGELTSRLDRYRPTGSTIIDEDDRKSMIQSQR
jgi:hypothetical protein